MRKLLMGSVLVVACGYALSRVNDPLNAFASFIIAGAVPGTNIMLGMWPTIGIGLVAFWFLLRWIKQLRLQALEHTARQITAERQTAQQNEGGGLVLDPNRQSVIAAPTSRAVF
jgi:hypothetical protein